ncbi:MAG: DUF6695 family protein [Bacteroidota bacterium]|nr:DUF6695 family protein [Bacteroidota bacterium]
MSLIAPDKPVNIESSCQWLGGVGAGSWFFISQKEELYKIERFSQEGKKEFSGIFKTDNEFDINQTYKFTYLSHYQFCTIIQNKKEIVFYLYNVAL